MAQEFYEDSSRETTRIHPTLLLISEILAGLGVKVFIIGARSIMVHGVELGRDTGLGHRY